MTEARKILVTSALPYANGSIHLGHMLEYVQTDMWVRYQKLRGNQAIYVCADDAHGSAIMLRAEKEGITPEQLIANVQAEHTADFADFGVEFDNYHSTHSEENRELSASIYLALRDAGHIATRAVTQYFDPEKGMFLADRFIKGTCPKCAAEDQYGDNCEKCGATYAPTELKNPRSAISGAVPVLKESQHFFFKLPDFEAMLKQWTRSGTLQDAVANKLAEWLDSGLQEWDISRDAPYFGFEIPDEPGKYFYVWLDAPIGYMASFKNLCSRRPELDFDAFWGKDSTAELYHFIGKDIVNFHALFWPAMLEGAGYRKPTAINVHGYLTVNGQNIHMTEGWVAPCWEVNDLDPSKAAVDERCHIGAHSSEQVLMVGDSHGAALGGFIDTLAKAEGFSVTAYEVGGCQVAEWGMAKRVPAIVLTDERRAKCAAMLDFIEQNHARYKAIFVVNAFNLFAGAYDVLKKVDGVPVDLNEERLHRFAAKTPLYFFHDAPVIDRSMQHSVLLSRLGLRLGASPVAHGGEGNPLIKAVVQRIPNAHWVDLAAAYQVFGRRIGQAQGDVGIAPAEVGEIVGGAQFKGQCRVVRHELRQRR